MNDVSRVRDAIAELDRLSAWDPSHPPTPEEILTPREHRNALDLDRTIVIGNRGVGKTFWSQSLVDPTARQHLANFYPRLGLDRVDAELGYSSGYSYHLTASERTIAQAEQVCPDSARIWEAVLLRFHAKPLGLDIGDDLRDVAQWLYQNAEQGERALRKADELVAATRRRFLLVFDGLDTLGYDWETVRHRLGGLIEFARLAKSFKSIYVKLFLRFDQADDFLLWRSSDAPKLYNERVRLFWDQKTLYELFFFHLRRDPQICDALDRIAPLSRSSWSERNRSYFSSPEVQQAAFSSLAGPSMGGGTNRGNTYNWVVNHLADAYGETTPRAFLIALASAAKHSHRRTPLDHIGIQAGVSEASQQRLREIEGDYWWIQTAFEPLAHAHVPCEISEFLDRWQSNRTAERILDRARRENKLPPLPLAVEHFGTPEESLLEALRLIGVIEDRRNGKINMPDIFRVAAGIKRKGGVKPPPRKGAQA